MVHLGDSNYYLPPQPRQPPPADMNAYSGEQQQPQLFNAKAFKIFGGLLALMAATTLALGVADVVMTKEAYCNPWETAGPKWCSTTGEPYIWVWVAVGIWASIPIFLAGLFSMCISVNPESYTRIFALLMFLSTFVFAPALIVLSAIEVWRGHAYDYTFYNLEGGVAAGTITGTGNPYLAKFIIPLVIAIIGAIMFMMTAVVTLSLCCCMQSIGIYLPGELEGMGGQAPTQVASTSYPPRPQITSSSQSYNVDYADGSAGYPYSRFSSSGPVMPTRYQSVPDPYSGGVSYGNFPSRPSNPFSSDFFKPNSPYFWM